MKCKDFFIIKIKTDVNIRLRRDKILKILNK